MAADLAASSNDQVHGLNYDPDFLASLPVLSPLPALPDSQSPSCSSPAESRQHPSLPLIRGVTASQFAEMHLRYVTTHAPDSVIFPFLHGLEGDNDAQNAFFYSNGSMATVNGADSSNKEHLKARAPRFRGLVWVASDEDEVEEYERALKARRQAHAATSHRHANPSGSGPMSIHSSRHHQDDLDDDLEDDIEEDDYSTSSLDDDEVEDEDFATAMRMDIDDHVDLNAGVVGMDVDIHGQHGESLLDHPEGSHMHPVVHAHRPTLSAIDTSPKAHSHRLSDASSTSSYDSACDEPSTSASPSPPPSTSGSPSLPTPPTPATSLPATPAISQSAEKSRDVPERITLTSTFTPRELLCIDRETGETKFVEPRVPDGISLRNFGIQVPIFATISDIVVYSPRGNTKAALAVASHFAHAVETKRRQRAARGQTDLLHYNVFVLQATPEQVVHELPHVVSRMSDEVVGSGAHTTGTDALTVSETHSANTHPHALTKQQQCALRKANTISFAQREKDEMRELTQASEILTVPMSEDEEERREFSASSTARKWVPARGQVFLGNANDVPLPPSGRRGQERVMQEEWEYKSNDPALGYGYDICIECDDMAPFPTPAHMRAAEEHVARLERRWADHCLQEMEQAEEGVDGAREIPVRPPPSAGLVVHLPFPSTVMYAGNSVLPFVSWLEGLMKPVEEPLTVGSLRERREKEAESRRVVSVSPNARPQGRRSTNAATVGHAAGQAFGGPSSLPPPTSFPTSFLPSNSSTPIVPTMTAVNAFTRMRSTSATHLTTPSPSLPLQPIRTRPLKILVYSADGYTESSSLALCILMSLRQLSLPEAYLELQVEKRRSFFVYQNEIAPLKRIEARLDRDRASQEATMTRHGRPAAASMSYTSSSIPRSFLASLGPTSQSAMLGGESLSSSAPSPASTSSLTLAKRPRASTLPPMSSVVSDHQLWFNDPRFDGSFPSRVLPFLYLGNLNHAANAYMLHALGITHVVSVGECALIPPQNGGSHCAATAKPGSLWIEEKEGRIKVLDIKGVCDDGIDSLEPQLPPICEWIDEARRSGGKVLVHCRVGVSRSATVTIAYVMKYLNIPLVDAYLIVRSRRLSVLIQPNMRLLYNLIGWEIKLAQERAGDSKERLTEELARCLNWPCLAKEVHALNEKYLH